MEMLLSGYYVGYTSNSCKVKNLEYAISIDWKIPNYNKSSRDMNYFKLKTKMHGVVAMGLGTYLSLTVPLKDRINIVLFEEKDSEKVKELPRFDNVHFISVLDFLKILRSKSRDLHPIFIGGIKCLSNPLLLETIDKVTICSSNYFYKEPTENRPISIFELRLNVSHLKTFELNDGNEMFIVHEFERSKKEDIEISLNHMVTKSPIKKTVIKTFETYAT